VRRLLFPANWPTCRFVASINGVTSKWLQVTAISGQGLDFGQISANLKFYFNWEGLPKNNARWGQPPGANIFLWMWTIQCFRKQCFEDNLSAVLCKYLNQRVRLEF